MFYYVHILFLFTISFALIADTIEVYNKTDAPLFAAVYKQKSIIAKSPAQRFTNPPKQIMPNQSVLIDRPARELGYDRELAFSANAGTLKDSFAVQEFNANTHTNIGDAQGATVYIAYKDGILTGFNTAEWKIYEPIMAQISAMKQQAYKTISDPIKKLIMKEYDVVKNNPYSTIVAQVRIGNELALQEREYVQKREPKIRAGLEKFLARSINLKKMPVIALVESGGGYRAMVCSMGWHLGAQKIGLMDTLSYMVGLSGSTWSIAGWLSSGLPLDQFIQQITPLLSLGLNISAQDFALIAKDLFIKGVFDQNTTLVDLYGALLANVLLKNFGDKRQQIGLSAQANRVAKAELPFPIYTAVQGETKGTQEWYEFSPYEVGGAWLKAYVPTWAFGRKFANGKSVDFAPEQSLGFLMGTWGSAFSATIEQIFAAFKNKENTLKPPFDLIVSGILDRIGNERITAAQVFNFAAGIQNSPVKNASILNIVDGGLAFNLPYPPISGERNERKADIIIILDASAGTVGNELRKVEQYAKNKNLKLPVFNYDGIDQRAVTIFKDEQDPSVPLVIYLARVRDSALIKANPQRTGANEFQDLVSLISNFDINVCISKGYCSTFNFNYKENEVKQLSALTEFNMRASGDIIKQAIDWKVKQLEKSSKDTQDTGNTKPSETVPLQGDDAGDGYIWNKPPNWQVKCSDGAQLSPDKSGCQCSDKTKKLKKRSSTKDFKSGATRDHWTCE